MPEIGEIKQGEAIGKTKWHAFIWVACESCGKKRWVHLVKGKPNNLLCLKCSRPTGKTHHAWKGGRISYSTGYTGILLQPDDFFYPMAECKGYVREHRLVVAKALNRCLLPWEVVHHKNGIKDDNRFENLEILPVQGKHNTMLVKELKKQGKLIEELQGRVTLLEAEVALVKVGENVTNL